MPGAPSEATTPAAIVARVAPSEATTPAAIVARVAPMWRRLARSACPAVLGWCSQLPIQPGG